MLKLQLWKSSMGAELQAANYRTAKILPYQTGFALPHPLLH